MSSSLAKATERLIEAQAKLKLAINEVKYELAVDRDNHLTYSEQIAYLEGLIWAEEKGLR